MSNSITRIAVDPSKLACSFSVPSFGSDIRYESTSPADSRRDDVEVCSSITKVAALGIESPTESTVGGAGSVTGGVMGRYSSVDTISCGRVSDVTVRRWLLSANNLSPIRTFLVMGVVSRICTNSVIPCTVSTCSTRNVLCDRYPQSDPSPGFPMKE